VVGWSVLPCWLEVVGCRHRSGVGTRRGRSCLCSYCARGRRCVTICVLRRCVGGRIGHHRSCLRAGGFLEGGLGAESGEEAAKEGPVCRHGACGGGWPWWGASVFVHQPLLFRIHVAQLCTPLLQIRLCADRFFLRCPGRYVGRMMVIVSYGYSRGDRCVCVTSKRLTMLQRGAGYIGARGGWSTAGGGC
jgi:hypothetical protein